MTQFEQRIEESRKEIKVANYDNIKKENSELREKIWKLEMEINQLRAIAARN